MPIFQYKGYKKDGSEISGTIEANSYRDAVIRLKETGLYAKSISESTDRKRLSIFKKIDISLLPHITRQLSTLLFSGVTLIDALSSISQESRGIWKNILIDIKEKIKGGSSFSRALEDYKNIFPDFYINMIAAGEASGTLDNVLKKLADFLEGRENIKAKVRTSMIYPVFMVCVGFIVLSFIFAFVLPKITKIFKDTHSALPFITIALIFISDIFQRFWWLIAGLILSVFFLFRRLKESNKIYFDRLILKLPGNIIQSLYYSRFARTLSFLLEGGLPMLKALELSAKAIGNKELELKVTTCGRKVSEGAKISTSLEGFPPVLLQLIATGERSGQLPGILNNAANAYEEEFSRKVSRAFSLLEPFMILCMGIIVGVIVLAVLLPIFQMNQLIK